jgi:hypothetical protein
MLIDTVLGSISGILMKNPSMKQVAVLRYLKKVIPCKNHKGYLLGIF